ncbi:hypothetical protein [Paenibacillus sp. GXUN7292]|uniref:hypothetical protein n=2 Tax=unclassified Paenibacillus TaxID=185978 RepID=UPI00337B53C7
MPMARIGVWIDKEAEEHRHRYGVNVFQHYIQEVLNHRGIAFAVIDSASQIKLEELDIVIAALPSESKDDAEFVWDYMQQGGIVISLANLSAFANRLGFRPARAITTGYANLKAAWLAESTPLLRGFDYKPWASLELQGQGEAIGSIHEHEPDGKHAGSVLNSFPVGNGRFERWAIDIPAAVVRLQQGAVPIVTDGIPAPDGTGAVDDWILKADDDLQQDWEYDRLATASGMSYFAYPYADFWRDAWIGHLLHTAAKQGLTIPFIGYWPDGIEQVAMISHDSDHNIDESAEITMKVLKEENVQSTWCMIEPGYSPHIYDKMREDGHEVAFHYNALPLDKGFWDEQEFERQLNWLKSAAHMSEVTSNKNHYTRFEGWGELFDWCERYNIASDQSRGPSKKGNIGFTFGTCHPYYPIAWSDQKNRMYNVLEIGFLTQDLDHSTLADSSVIAPFLEGVKQVNGVAHFLFHQVHILQQPKVREAIISVIKQSKAAGFVFWTGKQITDWTQAKRQLKINSVSDNGEIKVLNPAQASNAVVWTPVISGLDNSAQSELTLIYGLPCRKTIIN